MPSEEVLKTMTIKYPYKGLRIQIAGVAGQNFHGYEMADPHPEHIGKLGIITEDTDDNGLQCSPYIRLDDGTELRGYECWWHATP